MFRYFAPSGEELSDTGFKLDGESFPAGWLALVDAAALARYGIERQEMLDPDPAPPSATASATNATTLNLNTNVTAGSVCIGAVYTNPNGSATWTGLTEDLDILIESANGLTTASALLSSAETPRTISCAIASGVATNIVGCTGVWS